jgi:hypothetical protein
LAPQCFHIPALALNLGLIGVDLPLLIRLTVFLALQLIPNQYAGPESKSPADRRSGARMPNRRANDPTRGSSAERANAGAFFTRAEATTGTQMPPIAPIACFIVSPATVRLNGR